MSPGQGRPGGGGAPGAGGRGPSARSADASAQRLYVLQDGKPVERVVKTGLSDGERTEVLDGVRENETVIVGNAPKGAAAPAGGPRLRL